MGIIMNDCTNSPCHSSAVARAATVYDAGPEPSRQQGGMRAAILLTVLTVAASVPRRIVMDGWMASAAFRGEPSAVAQPWHGDHASGAAKRRRHASHASPAFDQIIVETLEQPAKHRPSLFLILFLFITGLFAGAVLLLVCILCLLKAFNGQIVYRSLEQNDNFCVVESRTRPVTDVRFKQRPVQTFAETTSVAKVDRDVAHSAPAMAPAHKHRQPRCAQESNRNRPAHKGSAKPQLTGKRDRGESANEHDCRKALSNLWPDLRINSKGRDRNNNTAPSSFSLPASSSASSCSSGEGAEAGNASKLRPLLFRQSPVKKAKDRNDCRRTNLWRDLRISKTGRNCNTSTAPSSFSPPASSSASSRSSGEGADAGKASKVRPLLFCQSPDKTAKDRTNCQRAHSNLRPDLRINNKVRNRKNTAPIGFSPPASSSASSRSSGEGADAGNASKVRPLLFCQIPDKKAKDRKSNSSVPNAKPCRLRDSSTVRGSNSQDSPINGVVEKFFSQADASEVYQANDNEARRLRGRSEPPRRAFTTPRLGSRAVSINEVSGRQQDATTTDPITLEQVTALLDVILKKSSRRSMDGF
ncbi:hypothetical protein V5799_009824 [Amblyomma americanum]|uniref:Uncharacterized protein n=1 Tax=Amblyomma americanum TaxID=6943 RepID=A0AAQ4F9S1_AMBAM